MTEVVTAPSGRESSELGQIGHWIGGARVAGTSGRVRPGLQPGHRRADEGGRVRLRRGGRRGCRGGRRGVPRLARDVAVEAHGDLLPHPRARPRPQGRDRAHPHRRARQGALGRDGGGAARPRGDRVRVRHPDAHEGRLLRAGGDRDRRLLHPPAARRRRRHHAVQLPRDGAHVDVGAGYRLRQRVRAQAVREGSFRFAVHRRAA